MIRKYIASGKVDGVLPIVNAFKQRVLDDGGTFEADAYLLQWLRRNQELYNRSDFMLTPNGYKAGTLYALKGTDMTFLRTLSSTRILPNLTEELLGENVPKIDYRHDLATPFLNLEPQVTNIWFNSSNQVLSVSTGIGQSYGISFYGSGTVTLSGAYNQTINGLSDTELTFVPLFAPATNSLTITVSGNVFWGNLQGRPFSSTVVPEFPSSHVPTIASDVTRTIDNCRVNLGTEIFETPYIVFMEFWGQPISGISGAGRFYHYSIESASDNGIFLNSTGGIGKRINSTSDNTFNLTSARIARTYGIRQRHAMYIEPATGLTRYQCSRFINNQWIITSSSPSVTDTLPIGMDVLRLGRAFSSNRATITKIKTFAIIKDFAGINNVNSYMNELLIKNSI
jgi:hypothetical protein